MTALPERPTTSDAEASGSRAPGAASGTPTAPVLSARPAPALPPYPAWWSARIVLPAVTLATLATLLVDRPAHRVLVWPAAAGYGWDGALRALGYLPTWLAVGAAFVLVDRPARRSWARGSFLVGAALSAGLLAEIAKLLVRRARPGEVGGDVLHFVPFSEDLLHSGRFGMPSSHASVAFGAAFALSVLWPRAGPLFFLLAAGCGLTRILAGAHFASDVLAAVAVGYLGARIAAAVVERAQRGSRGASSRSGPDGGEVR